MIHHSEISDTDLRIKLKNKTILFGGNKSAKIYGTLSCTSGKRLTRGNRVFFTTQSKAVQAGFRPCGHCMRKEYRAWKEGGVINVTD